ncbi:MULTISPECIES: DarT ssDNA thymidine ADP-ribosyltransferase family protein [unclassified Salinibacterium]|uniref:DarT ssDNA thymidine ADP-ribosyltransferase family protein n=1 Tax=unclassified Salinibacterium TaxID=2632331 RepID=UPI00143D575B|nr:MULTISPECIES: DarT ssDNA thymidine ADP-ribosyltransferase family protein [unclassified Salinibacterium]
MSECIHGLDKELCDICSPKPAPAAPPKVTKARTPRASAGAPRPARPAIAKRAPGAPVDKPINVEAHRVFHLTHVRNLAGIAERGALLPANSVEPNIDISSPSHREQRRAATLPEAVTAPAQAAAGLAASAETGTDAVEAEESAPSVVADCVPFFATPESGLWGDIRSGTPDPRLSAAARTSSVGDYVMLATTVAEIEKAAPLVLALDEASAPTAPMTADPVALRRELRRLIAIEALDGDERPLAGVELLVAGPVPIEAISLIGVANSKARDEVKAVLADAGVNIRVAVYPPWFVRS